MIIYSLTYSFSGLEPFCCSMSSSNCCVLTCIQVSQEAGQVVWYSHLIQNFLQFIVIHTVKGFGIVNKAEIDVFLELSCFCNGDPLQYSCLENPMDGGAWKAAVHGVTESRTQLSNFTFTFHFHALEKEMATHSSVLAWRIPGAGEPGGLMSMGWHRVGHTWSDLAAAAAAAAGRFFTNEPPGKPLNKHCKRLNISCVHKCYFN